MNNRIEKLEEKISFYKHRINYYQTYITKTELKINNLDTDHEIITRVELKEVSEQSKADDIAISVLLLITSICVFTFENMIILPLSSGALIFLLYVAGLRIFRRIRHISKLKKLNLTDKKAFLTKVFNGRINKCRFGIDLTKISILECEQDIEKLRKERQYS